MIIDYAPCANKYLSLTFAFCSVVAISDCIAGPSNQNIQCIQLEIANSKVMAIGPKSSQDCRSNR
jgi:hypothetical protein